MGEYFGRTLNDIEQRAWDLVQEANYKPGVFVIGINLHVVLWYESIGGRCEPGKLIGVEYQLDRDNPAELKYRAFKFLKRTKQG